MVGNMLHRVGCWQKNCQAWLKEKVIVCQEAGTWSQKLCIWRNSRMASSRQKVVFLPSAKPLHPVLHSAGSETFLDLILELSLAAVSPVAFLTPWDSTEVLKRKLKVHTCMHTWLYIMAVFILCWEGKCAAFLILPFVIKHYLLPVL